MRSGFLSSSKYLRFSSRSRLVSATTFLPGFLPSSRHHRRHPRSRHGFREPLAGCESSQPLASFRPQVFSTSRRLAPSSASRACFIPQPRPGCLAPFRGFSRPAAVPNSSLGPAPLPLVALELTGDPAATRSSSASRLCSAVRSVPRGRWLAFLSVAPLVGFLLLRVARFTTAVPVPRGIHS